MRRRKRLTITNIVWARVGENFPSWRDSNGNAYPTSPSHSITDLDEGVRYKVQVRARYNGTSGSWTEPVEAVVASAATATPTSTPSATPIPTATPTETPSESQTLTESITPSFDYVEDSILVTWDPPVNGSVTHYILIRTHDVQGVVNTKTIRIEGTSTTYTDNDVEFAFSYDYAVTAYFTVPTATATPTDTTDEQEVENGPTVSIEFAPSASVSAGTAITVTLKFGNLKLDANAKILFRGDVVDADNCEETASALTATS